MRDDLHLQLLTLSSVPANPCRGRPALREPANTTYIEHSIQSPTCSVETPKPALEILDLAWMACLYRRTLLSYRANRLMVAVCFPVGIVVIGPPTNQGSLQKCGKFTSSFDSFLLSKPHLCSSLNPNESWSFLFLMRRVPCGTPRKIVLHSNPSLVGCVVLSKRRLDFSPQSSRLCRVSGAVRSTKSEMAQKILVFSPASATLRVRLRPRL